MKHTTKYINRIFKSKEEMIDIYNKHIKYQEEFIAKGGRFADAMKESVIVARQELQERLKEFDK
jgi:hypothetical protein